MTTIGPASPDCLTEPPRTTQGSAAVRRSDATRTGSCLPGAAIYTVLFIAPTFASFYFAFTRWTLFEVQFIGSTTSSLFFSDPQLTQGLHQHAHLRRADLGAEGRPRTRARGPPDLDIMGRGYLRAVIFFPVLVSTIGVGITFQALLDPYDGVINQTLALVRDRGTGMADRSQPRAVLDHRDRRVEGRRTRHAHLSWPGIVAIPREYYEAAKIDGASGWKSFRNITVPLVRPATTTVVILSLIGGLRSFDLDLGDDGRRARFRQRRHRVRHLQAVRGRVLRPVHGGQRRPLRRRHRRHPAAVLVAQPKADRPMKSEQPPRHVVGIIADPRVGRRLPRAVRLHRRAVVQDRPEAADLEFTWPSEFVFVQNIVDVFQTNDYMLVTAFINSTILTVASVTIMVVLVGDDRLGRRPAHVAVERSISFLVLAGLIVPPAVVPTVWVLQGLGLFKTLRGLVLVEVAYGMSFCILLFRAFVSTIPRELDEAARSTAPARSVCSSRSGSPCCAA